MRSTHKLIQVTMPQMSLSNPKSKTKVQRKMTMNNEKNSTKLSLSEESLTTNKTTSPSKNHNRKYTVDGMNNGLEANLIKPTHRSTNSKHKTSIDIMKINLEKRDSGLSYMNSKQTLTKRNTSRTVSKSVLTRHDELIVAIEYMRDLLKFGTEKPYYFINKDVINDEGITSDDKYDLDKILKLNSYAEGIENMLHYVQQMKTKNRENLSQEEMFDDESIIKSASNRRVEVYEELFQSIKNNFEQIITIASLSAGNTQSKNSNQNLPNVITNSNTNNNIYNNTSDNSIKINLNLNIGSGKIKKLNSKNNIVSDLEMKEAECEDSSVSSGIDYDCYANEEIFSKIKLPDSHVKNVNIKKIEGSNISRQLTRKQFLTKKLNMSPLMKDLIQESDEENEYTFLKARDYLTKVHSRRLNVI